MKSLKGSIILDGTMWGRTGRLHPAVAPLLRLRWSANECYLGGSSRAPAATRYTPQSRLGAWNQTPRPSSTDVHSQTRKH